MSTSITLPVTLATLFLLPAGCGPKSAGTGTDTASQRDTSAQSPSEKPNKDKKTDAKPSKNGQSGASVQKALKVTIAGKTVGGVYAFAQLHEQHGENYRLTFINAKASCATMQQVMMKQHKTLTHFSVQVQRAIKPDGTLVWAYAGLGFANGGSAPASLVEMPKLEVKDGTLSATLPADVGYDDKKKGKLTVGGSFSAPICSPIKAMKPRLWMSSEEAVDLPVKNSTAKVTIAGKSFDVKGATAFPQLDGKSWEVRLTAKPHGCSMNVGADLILMVRVGGDSAKIGVGGHWIAGGTTYQDLEGLKAKHTKTKDSLTLTLSGEQAYAPTNKVVASGVVTAAICKTK